MAFVRAFQEAILNNKKKKTLFAGRKVNILNVERLNDREINALCDLNGRGINLQEHFREITECSERFAELKKIEAENAKKNSSIIQYS